MEESGDQPLIHLDLDFEKRDINLLNGWWVRGAGVIWILFLI